MLLEIYMSFTVDKGLKIMGKSDKKEKTIYLSIK